MILIAVLVGLGLLLLAAEVIVPGAVLGIVGGVLLLVGIGVAFTQSGPTAGFVVLAISLAAGALVFAFEFIILPRSKLARAFSMNATVTGHSHTLADQPAALVGREATTQTKLVPSGVVLVGDKRYEAFSRDGAIEAGVRVHVVGVDNFRLIVTQQPS